MTRRMAVAAIALIAVVVTGCGTPGGSSGQSSSFKRLVIGRTGDIDKLDPHQATAHQTYQMLNLVYENLTELDKDLNVKPALATSWEYSNGGTQLTFHLRKGVKFDSGADFTSADVKATIDNMLDPKSGAISRDNLLSIAEVTTPDPVTVVLKLSRQDATLPAAFSDLNTAMESAADISAGTIARKPDGTGPFIFKTWTQGESVSLDANPNWWGGKPSIRGIDIRVLPDESSIVAGMRAHQFDLGVINSPATAKQVSSPLQLAQASALTYWPFMMHATYPPLSDVRVRQAISCAIDRKQVIQAAAFGQGDPTGPFTLPAYETDSFDGLPCKGPNIEVAKKLLAEAGYGNGLTLQTIILTGPDPTSGYIAQNVKSQLAQVGITLELQNMETNVYVAKWLKGDWQTSVSPNSGRSDPALVYARIFRCGAATYIPMSWCSKTTDQLMTEGQTETDPVKRKQIYATIAKDFVEASPEVWLFKPRLYWVLQPNLKGFVPMANESLVSLRSVRFE